MIIKTTKGSYKKVPEGMQDLLITEVKLVPSGRPQKAEFNYEHENGATMKEFFDFSSKIGQDILGKRCDVLYNGDMPEGTEIDTSDLPAMFEGKVAKAMVVHKDSTKDGKTRTFANIKYVESYSDPVVQSDDEDDDDEL